MTFEEYVTYAERTIPNDDGYVKDLYHSGAGLVTEAQEFEDAFTDVNKVEELGDMCWFLALFYKHHKFNFGTGAESASHYNASVVKLRKTAINFLDCAKARSQYNRDNVAKMKSYAESISTLIVLISAGCGFSLDDIFQKNINKLNARYKETFTTEEANNRDLGKEEVELRR